MQNTHVNVYIQNADRLKHDSIYYTVKAVLFGAFYSLPLFFSIKCITLALIYHDLKTFQVQRKNGNHFNSLIIFGLDILFIHPYSWNIFVFYTILKPNNMPFFAVCRYPSLRKIHSQLHRQKHENENMENIPATRSKF